jgi:hypothetical protein
MSIRTSWRRAAAALAGVLVLPWAGSASADAPEPDWRALWARVLERHTERVDAKVGTRVDYAALRSDADWRALTAALERFDPTTLASRRDRIAFWIDAYNVLAIRIVLEHWPVESIRDIGSFFRPVWKREAGRIGGRGYSLDEIEHEILRPMGEPRIHGAIVCASISCPDLRREPYRPERLDAQLDDNVRAWLAHDDKGLAIDRAAADIRLSPIFDWFEEDFAAAGGVLAFVARYAPPDARAWLEANADRADVSYFDYDWGLND